MVALQKFENEIASGVCLILELFKRTRVTLNTVVFCFRFQLSLALQSKSKIDALLINKVFLHPLYIVFTVQLYLFLHMIIRVVTAKAFPLVDHQLCCTVKHKHKVSTKAGGVNLEQ